MNTTRSRSLSVGPIRAFEAVARHLSFSAAATELFLTQSAVSRQIRSLEDEVGAALFLRGTRHVELTSAGQSLLRAVAPSLERLDAAVRQIRTVLGRRHVSLTTFASFASLWLLPRLHSFQATHADIDIRVSAGDALVSLDDPELDIALRYCHPDQAPAGAERMFGEVLTPVVSPRLLEQAAAGHAPPLATAADLAQHALLDEDAPLPGTEYLNWRRWLTLHGLPRLEPRRWVHLNFTYQQIRCASARPRAAPPSARRRSQRKTGAAREHGARAKAAESAYRSTVEPGRLCDGAPRKQSTVRRTAERRGQSAAGRRCVRIRASPCSASSAS